MLNLWEKMSRKTEWDMETHVIDSNCYHHFSMTSDSINEFDIYLLP